MLKPIEDRLQASINMDVINGDSFERGIFEKQIKEAIINLKYMRQELTNMSSIKLDRFLDYEEFYFWVRNRAGFVFDAIKREITGN
jgi:hypothetical protein